MGKRKTTNILVTGSEGQIGSELVSELRRRYGAERVVACDLKQRTEHPGEPFGPFENVDVSDARRMAEVCRKYRIATVAAEAFGFWIV